MDGGWERHHMRMEHVVDTGGAAGTCLKVGNLISIPISTYLLEDVPDHSISLVHAEGGWAQRRRPFLHPRFTRDDPCGVLPPAWIPSISSQFFGIVFGTYVFIERKNRGTSDFELTRAGNERTANGVTYRCWRTVSPSKSCCLQLSSASPRRSAMIPHIVTAARPAKQLSS